MIEDVEETPFAQDPKGSFLGVNRLECEYKRRKGVTYEGFHLTSLFGLEIFKCFNCCGPVNDSEERADEFKGIRRLSPFKNLCYKMADQRLICFFCPFLDCAKDRKCMTAKHQVKDCVK